MEYAIQLKNVTKTFGKVVANKNVNLDVKKGEILSLLGENGSGKTTLMNMISGIYFPDSGEIMIDGRKVEIRSPKDAYDLGIGMIHQHFKLIDVFSATENIALGLDKKQKFDLKEVKKKAKVMNIHEETHTPGNVTVSFSPCWLWHPISSVPTGRSCIARWNTSVNSFGETSARSP